MAGSFIPFQEDLGNLIAHLRAQVEALATTPAAGNQSIAQGSVDVLSSTGQVQTLMGLYVWPTAPWAGTTIYGHVTFDGSGNPIVVMGLQPDGKYGVGIYNPSGVREVYLGNTSTTNYGLYIANSAGTLQQVGGTLAVTGNNSLAQTGSFSSPTSLSTSITATIGPSHQAEVTFGCGVGFGTATQANLELRLDGSRITLGGSIAAMTTYVSSSAGAATTQRTVLIDCGTAASHTFSLHSWDPGSGTWDVLHPALVVNPL